MPIDLFPTDALLRALDEPGSLLDDLDAAGVKAAAAFEAQPGSPHEKARAFQDVLVADPFVPRATRQLVTRSMPVWWEAVSARSRDGQLASLVARLEAESLAGGSDGAHATLHPVLAYVDEVGVEAARHAFDAYRAALPPTALAPAANTLMASDVFETATRAGTDRFLSALGARAAGDIFSFFQREAPPAVFWTTVVASAAGALGVLIVGPKLATDAAAALGIGIPPISADIDVARFGEHLEIRFGGTVRILSDALADGPLWQQALDKAFGAETRIGLRFGDAFDLTTAVSWAPENREWGVKLTFTMLKF